MLAVADTNHLSEIDRSAVFAARFDARRRASGFEIFTSIITIQEMAKGWLALLNRPVRAREQVSGYARFQRGVEALRAWDILAFDEEAATVFEVLLRRRLRVGTMDLKIASICLAHDATLLTRNVTDFATVPGLRVENWLD